MNKKIAFLILGSALLTQACSISVEDCDPNDTSFTTTWGCALTGTYAKRLELKKQDLANLQAQNKYLKSMLKTLENEKDLTSKDLEQKQKAINALNKDLNDLKKSLADNKALSESLQQELDTLQKEVDKLDSMPLNAAALEKMQTVSKLKGQLEHLQNLIAQEY